jgi:hypothetical protein
VQARAEDVGVVLEFMVCGTQRFEQSGVPSSYLAFHAQTNWREIKISASAEDCNFVDVSEGGAIAHVKRVFTRL